MPGIKNDQWIKHMAKRYKMIEPFVDKLISNKISYADRKGKYQGQKGITLPKAGK